MTTVLVADDDPELRELARIWLAGQGHSVVTTGTGFTAVQLAAECRPDLLVVEAHLPDLDAIAVIEYVRAFSHVPILVLAAAEHWIAPALASGADDYLMTPYDPIDLLDRVKALLATRPGVAGVPAPRDPETGGGGQTMRSTEH